MDGHLLCSSGTPNPEISERSFLKGEGLFLRDRIPFVALRKNGIFKTLPCQEGTRDRRSQVLLIFVFLFLFRELRGQIDRKSTRLNSSHMSTSYAASCL